MANIPFVKKKIGETYLVWFKRSNLFYQFKEPVWFIFSELIKETELVTIANKFSEHYAFGFDKSMNFVKEVQSKINELNEPDIAKQDGELSITNLKDHNYKPSAVHQYVIGKHHVQFSYETDWLESYIHPLAKHLETKRKNLYQTHFELFTHKHRVIFRLNNKIQGNWAYNESHLIKGKIFMSLMNSIYNKTDSDWLMSVHASAVSNGKKTILFSAPPNSGKSTIATLLLKIGYHVISDDFVAIDRHFFKAYPFPLAISVKESALNLLAPYFPALKQKQLTYINSEKSVKYLPFDENSADMILPVREFIFIKYDKTIDFKLDKLNSLHSIKLLLEQTWVSPTFKSVETLFEKIERCSFFQLTYSNNDRALQAITQLFEHE